MVDRLLIARKIFYMGDFIYMLLSLYFSAKTLYKLLNTTYFYFP